MEWVLGCSWEWNVAFLTPPTAQKELEKVDFFIAWFSFYLSLILPSFEESK
jgi:hypothetical protein